MAHNGEVNSRFKVRIPSARCRHAFWLFTVSSGVAPQCECSSGLPQRSSMNATCQGSLCFCAMWLGRVSSIWSRAVV